MPSQRGVRLSARECALLIALGLPVLLIHLCDYIADIGDSQLGSGNDSGCSWQRDLSLLELFSGSATLTATYSWCQGNITIGKPEELRTTSYQQLASCGP
ncbi:unnamed protein product [Durusdinium trenchii]|uniref:Uncharacterized protein n=1 Tax=Durusdinium trenchii TaxID=1381693 RepID=A0ABP0R359_9DINO